MKFDSVVEYEKWLADKLKEHATKEKVVEPKPKPATKA